MTIATNKVQEVLVVSQGFETGDQGRIEDFTMDDFRGDKLPHFGEQYNSMFRSFYRIQKHDPRSRCPWGYSRWITGTSGKLRLLDTYWDSTG